MLARLALALTAEAVDLTVTEEAVAVVGTVEEEEEEEDGEDTRLLLIHFCLKHRRYIHYSGGLLVWVLLTNSGPRAAPLTRKEGNMNVHEYLCRQLISRGD